MKNIVVLVSGGGTNLQALIDAQNKGNIHNGKITCVISSNPDAYALKRAENNQIKTYVLTRKEFLNNREYAIALTELLNKENADLIILAGFMTILDEYVIKAYPNKIINIHPALIPSFCGKGYYGLKVHEEALKKGVKVTGATVHFVNEVADDGAIIMQGTSEVRYGDTPEVLQKRVMEEVEWKLLPKVASLFCEDKIFIENGNAYIKE